MPVILSRVLVDRPFLRRAVAACALLAAAGASALVASTTNVHAPAGETSPNSVLSPTNADIAVVMRTAGLTPENLAAAGVTRLEFGGIADAAMAYCLQADRADAFQKAHKSVNIMRTNATKVPAKRTPLEGPGAPDTLAQAQGRLDDLKSSAFNFLTAGLPSEKKARLASIRANAKHAVPAYYKVVNRTDRQWLDLRNALSAKRTAEKKSAQVPASAAAVLAAAHADQAVSNAKDGYAAFLPIIQDEWRIKLPKQAQGNTLPGDQP